MLQLVAQLCQYAFGYVGWLLGDKVNTDALGTDEADNLFNLIQKGLRCILKNQMSFVKKTILGLSKSPASGIIS